MIDQSNAIDYRKNLIILSAPSATGKNTVFNAVKTIKPDVERVITVTTRAPKKNEKDGVDYYFLTDAVFRQKEKNGEFVESNRYDDGYYATPYSEINRYPETTLLFLIVDINGMKAVKDKYPFSKSIFLMPPSIEELKSRISSRGDNTPEEIENRIGMAVLEINESKNYDFVVANNDVVTAAKEIVKIISTQEI